MFKSSKNKLVLGIGIVGVLFSINCKKEKEDNSRKIAAAALIASSNPSASPYLEVSSDGVIASKITAPASLSLLQANSSVSASTQEAITKVRNIIDDRGVKACKDLPNLASSEYCTDKVQKYVEDPISNQLKLFDSLFRMISLSGYKYVIDKGTQPASFTQPEDTSSTGTTASTDAQSQTQKNNWTIEASSKDGTGAPPITVKIWGTMYYTNASTSSSTSTPPTTPLEIKLTINEAPSDTNPYGKFTLIAKAGSGKTTEAFQGSFYANGDVNKDGKLELITKTKGTFPLPGGLFKYSSVDSVRLVYDKANESGVITFRNKINTTSFTGGFAFDKEYVYALVPPRAEDIANAIKSGATPPTVNAILLNRNNPDTFVYRYGLYKQDGKKFILNTGFPVKTTDAAATKAWASIYGVQYFDSTANKYVALADGTKVKRIKLDGSDDTQEYTVSNIPGYLRKTTRTDVALTEFVDKRLDWWKWDSATSSSYKYVVKWNGTQWLMVKKCTYDVANNNKETCADLTPSAISFDKADPASYYYQGIILRVSGLSDNNGRYIYYKSVDLSGNPTTTVGVYDESVVDSLSADLTLYSFHTTALTVPLTSNNCASSAVYQFNYNSTTAPATQQYFVSKGDLTLYQGASADTTKKVIFGSGITNGLCVVEKLMEKSLADKITKPSDYWSKISSSDIQTTYTWRTGTNAWDSLTRLKTADGTALKFDYPARFAYEYTNANNEKFVTEVTYNGYGQLAIPWEVNTDTKDFVKAKPKFVIPDGTELTRKEFKSDGTSVDVTYYVKWLQYSQKLKVVDEATLTAEQKTKVDALKKSITTVLEEPADTLLAEPSIGTKPTPKTNATATIEGEPACKYETDTTTACKTQFGTK